MTQPQTVTVDELRDLDVDAAVIRLAPLPDASIARLLHARR